MNIIIKLITTFKYLRYEPWFLFDITKIFYNKVKYRLFLKNLGKNSIIFPSAKIRHPQKVEIGDNVVIYDNVLIYGGDYSGYVKIGNFSHIAPFSLINGQGGVKIGSKVAIGGGTMIYSISQDVSNISKNIIDNKPILGEVVIENNVFIGANTVIFPGIKICSGAVIGAGSVVNKDIPPYYIVAGVPARIIKKRKSR